MPASSAVGADAGTTGNDVLEKGRRCTSIGGTREVPDPDSSIQVSSAVSPTSRTKVLLVCVCICIHVCVCLCVVCAWRERVRERERERENTPDGMYTHAQTARPRSVSFGQHMVDEMNAMGAPMPSLHESPKMTSQPNASAMRITTLGEFVPPKLLSDEPEPTSSSGVGCAVGGAVGSPNRTVSSTAQLSSTIPSSPHGCASALLASGGAGGAGGQGGGVGAPPLPSSPHGCASALLATSQERVQVCVCTYTSTHKHRHTRTRTRMHACTHARMHAHAHKHTGGGGCRGTHCCCASAGKRGGQAGVGWRGHSCAQDL